MAWPGSKRRVWAVLLHVILLVTPNKLPALRGLPNQPGTSANGVATSSWGIVAVESNLLGSLLADKALDGQQWGATGEFAGFTGLSLARSECSDLYDPNDARYASPAEAAAVFASPLGETAIKYQRIWQRSADGFDLATEVVGLVNDLALVLYWVPYAGARLWCGAAEYQTLDDDPDNNVVDNSPPEPVGDASRTGFRGFLIATYETASKTPSVRALVPTARFLVNQFVTPLKQAGSIISIAGRIAKVTAAAKAGKTLSEFMDEPEEKMRTVINTTTVACKRTNTYLNFMQERVIGSLELVADILGLLDYIFLFWSYGTCERQEKLINAAIQSVRAAGQAPGGRKLHQTSTALSPNELNAEAAQILAAAEVFFTRLKSASDNFNGTFTPPTVAAVYTWTNATSVVESAIASVEEAVTFFNFMPGWFVAVIYGFADKMSFITKCPDWICGLGSILEDIVDWAFNSLIKKIGRGIQDFGDLIIVALEEFGAPVPKWFKATFDINLPFDDVSGLFGFTDIAETAVNQFKTDITQSLNELVSNVLLKLTPGPEARTRVLDLSSDSNPNVKRRMSTTSAGTIDIACPAGTAGIYMDSFTVLVMPDCNADYTTWLRFPCPSGVTSCTVDWTRYDWKCYRYQDAFNPAAAVGMPQRYVTAVYDCVTTQGLTNFTLLPELLSASKTGDTALPNVNYNSTTNLPAVDVLRKFADGIGRLGSVDASLIPNPKPGLRSNAASTPSTPTAAPPFDAYSQGSLNYPLLNRFFERDGYTPVSYSCSGAAAFGLPTLLVEGIEVDACYDTGFWNETFLAASFNGTFLSGYPPNRGLVYDSQYDVRYWRFLNRDQAEALRADMCGWRMVAKRGYIGALQTATKNTLRGMVPPLLLPWSAPPTEQQFRDFWGPRGACEHFSDGGTGRSHLSHSTWKVTTFATEAECARRVLGPTCYPGRFPTQPSSSSATWSSNVVCDTNSMPANSLWPLISPAADPVLKTAAVPASVCGQNTPSDNGPNRCFSDKPSWCGPRGRVTSGTGPTADVDENLPTDLFTTMTYYFANLSTTTVAAAQLASLSLVATPARQWAAECSLDFTRGLEYAARKAMLDAHAARQSTTLSTACAATLAACQLTKGSCPVSELFRCSKNLGIIQYACIPDPESFKGSTMTLVFKVSLVNQNKRISCGANQALQIMSAEVGAGTTTKDAMVAVVQRMCNTNGTACILDANSGALNSTGANDVLKVVWRCTCVLGYTDPTGNGTCQACAAGTYQANASSICTLTPPGTYTNNTASTAPVPCPPGTFAEKYGQTECTLCPALTFSAAVGAANSSTCTRCVGANSYSPPGASQCSTCPIGAVLVVATANTTNATITTSTCVECSPGTYRTAAEDICTACNAGTYAAYGGTNTSLCTPAPAGSYAPTPGSVSPTPCDKGTYQPAAGSTECIPCTNGTTTNTTGATDASACIPTVVVPASELPALLELANTSATTGSRRLAAVDDPNGPCARLAIALEEKGLVKNASTFLGEVGNSFCSSSPWLNSAACNYDGGDCCPSTCQPLCEQVSTADTAADTIDTYISFTWSCAKFQCRDPEAKNNNTKLTINCTGTAVNNPGSLLQRLLLPVAASDVVNAEEALKSIAPAKEAPAGTKGVCDPNLNNAANSWDGGDCCEKSCTPNPDIPGSCTNIPAAACLDPTFNNPEQQPADRVAPTLIAPADYPTQCGSTLIVTTGLTAYDLEDGLLPASGPTISSSQTVTLTDPLPCPTSGEPYTVSLEWTATDGSGNSVSATQTVSVLPRPTVLSCSGNPTTPANALTFDCKATEPGGQCSTLCKTGYTLVRGNLTAVCSNDAVPVWSAVTGKCKPSNCTSPGPEAPANAVDYSCPVTRSGSNCSTTCLPGYELAADTSLQVTCRLGNWSMPDGLCNELECSGTTPLAPENAKPFNCSSSSVGDSCSTTCTGGHTRQGSLTSTCRRGQWSNVTGSCIEQACATRPTAPTGAMNYSSCRPPVARGATCSTICDPRHVLARGSLAVRCNGTGWSTATGVCALLPTQPGCGRTCLCPTKAACTSGAAKDKCAWSDAAGKCFVMPP